MLPSGRIVNVVVMLPTLVMVEEGLDAAAAVAVPEGRFDTVVVAADASFCLSLPVRPAALTCERDKGILHAYKVASDLAQASHYAISSYARHFEPGGTSSPVNNLSAAILAYSHQAVLLRGPPPPVPLMLRRLSNLRRRSPCWKNSKRTHEDHRRMDHIDGHAWMGMHGDLCAPSCMETHVPPHASNPDFHDVS